jgi:hypothetical protein
MCRRRVSWEVEVAARVISCVAGADAAVGRFGFLSLEVGKMKLIIGSLMGFSARFGHLRQKSGTGSMADQVTGAPSTASWRVR